MYKVDTTPIVGLPQFSGWSQVVSQSFSGSHLVTAFCIQGDHAGNVGRDFTEKIKQEEITSAAQLKRLFDQLLDKAEEIDVRLKISVAILSSKKVILGVYGGSVFLKRDQRTGVLLKSQDEVKIVEGQRNESDILVLLTQQAQQFVNEIELKFKSGFDHDSVVASIVPGLHDLEDSSLSSLAFISGGREEKLSADEVEDKGEKKVAPIPIPTIPPSENLQDKDESKSVEKQEVKEKQESGFFKTKRPEEKNEKEESHKNQQAPSLEQVALGVAVAKPAQTNIFFTLLKGLGKLLSWILQGLKKIISKLKELLAKQDFKALFQKIWQKLQVFFAFLKTFFRKITAQDVYLQTKDPRQVLRRVLPILIGLLLLGGVITWQVIGRRQQIQSAQKALSPFTHQIAQLEKKSATEPLLARESLTRVIAELEQLSKDFIDQKPALKLVATQLDQAKALQEEISGQEEVSQLEIFYDLRPITNNFLVTQVDATASQAAFLDAQQKKIMFLDLKNKNVGELDLSNLEKVTDLELNTSSSDSPQLFILAEGVLGQNLSKVSLTPALSLQNSQPTLTPSPQQLIDRGDSNQAATLIESFGTYAYVLNPEKRNIYRYAKQEEGYSKPIGWVSGAAGFDYAQVSSWAIDGDVWVATRMGEIHRLTSGSEVEFEIKGLVEPFASTLYVFTNENTKNLYVLEPDANRLVILSKEGDFLREIKSQSLATGTGLFVSEELKKAFVMSGSIVYGMDI